MFRKRKVATPGFGHTPYNPIAGDQANLRQSGTAPFCAMMQVAAEDTYDDYVICRGFDPRILKFIDYAAGDSNKPGISVAKPFGKRTAGTYQIAEIYPAFLPTQGNAGFADFRQVVFTPPSPSAVNWRVGQNPGTCSTGLEGGQPDDLSDEIAILYDHNEKAVNWLLIDSRGGSGSKIFFEVDSAATAGATSPYNGNMILTVTITVAPCDESNLIGTSVDVVDWSTCLANAETTGDVVNREGWAFRGIAQSLASTASPGDLTPCHWVLDGLCCP